MAQARRSAELSHNHPEGIKGAQATALAVFLARKNEDKNNYPQADRNPVCLQPRVLGG
jgi:ADP-ribosylglycohydrolase